ncbi:MAG TPA: gamma-glutamyltransferase, partial [Bryobacteraceae bacterium]|nr:gamma-glutamyltransferase [Bryobacteraceae bacterium]
MLRKSGILLIVLTVVACAQRYERPLRQSWRGVRGAIAGGSEPAVEAGARLYHQGGNAVDAGIATTLAAAVFEFSHLGLGGEAPILVRTKDGKVHSIIGVGTMPKAATAEFFRHRPLVPGEILYPPERGGLKGMVPVAGLMPALVPGMMDAALVTLREYGTKSFAQVVEPAIELADGVPLDETRVSAIERSRRFFQLWPSSRHVFLPDGRPPAIGEVFRQPDLARTLRSLVEAEKHALASGVSRVAAIDAVRDAFYRGDIARRIDAFSREHHGLLRYEDMAAFRVQPEDAVTVTYRDYQVYKPGFVTQGPSMLEALNILEGFDLRSLRWNSAAYIHTVVEALKLAYADRDTYYGDP